MNRPRGLGRGLDALIPDTSGLATREGESMSMLAIDSIVPNPQQPRKEFREEEIAALAESVREQGLLQPILVRRRGDATYELIAGERRWRAVKRAGFDEIPAIVRDATVEEMLPLALVENLMREDLNPIEEAEAYRALGERSRWTQEEIARRVGKGRVHVANTLRLLGLPREIREDVAAGTLSPAHARALLTCRSEAEMLEMRERVHAQNLSVRELEDRLGGAPDAPRRKRRARRSGRPAPRTVSPETRELEERLQRIFGTPVQIHERNGRGRVSLEFFSYDDLGRLTDLLLAAEERSPL
jgi:ParB family chromosome partitioning protein